MSILEKYPGLNDKMFSMRIGEVLICDGHTLEILRIFNGWIFIFKDSTPMRNTVSTQFAPIPS